MTLNLPTKSWHLWSRGDLGYRLEVSWPNSLAAPITIEGFDIEAMCARARLEWAASIPQSTD